MDLTEAEDIKKKKCQEHTGELYKKDNTLTSNHTPSPPPHTHVCIHSLMPKVTQPTSDRSETRVQHSYFLRLTFFFLQCILMAS